MANKQFMLPANRAFNSNGLALPGATAELYLSGGLVPANFYSDTSLTTSLGPVLTANGAGRFDISAYQDETTAFRLIVKDRLGGQLDDIDPFFFGVVPGVITAATGNSYSTRTLMAAALSPIVGQSARLEEAGREGNFVVDLASNWTAAIAADTAQGLFVPSTADATKVYVRQIGNGPYNPTWWGVVIGDTSVNAAANTAAYAAMVNTLAAISWNATDNIPSLGTARFPPGVIWMGDAGAGAAIDLQQGTLHIEGAGCGFDSGGRATIIKLSGAITGIRVQSANTSGATTSGVNHKSAAGSSIRDLAILGTYTTAESEAYGVHLRAQAVCERVRVDSMAGDGFLVIANAGGNNGNCNLFQINQCMAFACRTGFKMSGADANAGTLQGCLASGSRQWDYWDNSFLGNSFVGCLSESFGQPAGGSPFSGVSFGGNQYAVIPGQEAGASTNAPSGTTADNTWWIFLQAGGVTSIYEAWTSGHTYRAGGSYHNDSINQSNASYVNCYDESNGVRSWVVSPAKIFGGFLSLSRHKSANLSGFGPAPKLAADASGSWFGDSPFKVNNIQTDETILSTLGGTGTQKTALRINGSVSFPADQQLRISGGDILFDYGTVNIAFRVTGPTTTQQFGTGANVGAGFFYAANIQVGNSVANGRTLSNATSAPSATAAGQFYFNRTPTATGPFGWLAFSGSAATPVPATPVYSGLGTNPIGYTAGAGGTVTQITSKSTGVTLNTLCGEITMEATTSLASQGNADFVLTNSQIAAKDLIVANIVGGAAEIGKYTIQASVTAAGSATFALHNASGATLAEGVVVRFAVIKAVNA